MFLTILVPEASVVEVRDICAGIGASCANMFTRQVSGVEGVFYIASGFMPVELVALIPTFVEQYGVDVSSENPMDAMGRLQLTFID